MDVEVIEPAVIALAMVAGILAKRIDYPPMLGFLATGFLVHGFGIEAGNLIDSIANAGITLLLFTIGLKLNLKQLAAPQVWAVASAHMILVVAIFGSLLWLLIPFIASQYSLNLTSAMTIAFALSFSSTVFAVKIFDEQGEAASIYARLAIGVLIMQDLVAVAYLASSLGKWPGTEALLLLLLLPLRPLIFRLLRFCGHGELLVLFGITIAFGGAALFESFYIKGDLGALLLGILLAGTRKSNELAKSLFALKDLFLVGFFVSIGLSGTPSLTMLLIALALALLGCFKFGAFFLLFTRFKLRARTSLLSSLSLFSYSEFGLIVAAIAAGNGLISNDWIIIIALAVSLSFFIAVPLNARANEIYMRFGTNLRKLQRTQRLSEEETVDIGNATILVAGMGRVGVSAYRYFDNIPGQVVAGIEADEVKTQQSISEGLNVYTGDALDRDFWLHMNFANVKLILIGLTHHQENLRVVHQLRDLDYPGEIAVIARFTDELTELKAKGCIAFNLYQEAGFGFAEHVYEELRDTGKLTEDTDVGVTKT